MSVNRSRVNDESIPVAKPANPLARARIRTAPDESFPADAEWWTPEAVKSWATSGTVHALALCVMALWYYAPPAPGAKTIDTRLMGSELGVEEGLTATGGLNTEIELVPPPMEAPETALAYTPSADSILRMPELSDDVKPSPSDKPSAGGGMNNPNPGAGNGDGFGLAKFGEGGESIRGVEVKVGDPQFTLLWDTEVDLDLHVIEPGGKEIYWEDPKGKHGGELDVDNTKGFGPENIYWLHEDEKTGNLVKGSGPPGDYRWFVVYWGGFGGVPKPTRWKVRIKHAGKVSVVSGKFKALNERSRVYSLKVDGSAPTATAALP